MPIERVRPRGYEQLTVAGTAVGFASIPATGPELALIDCETADVRWRDDGTNPTASVGKLLRVGDELAYDGNMSDIKFIRTGSTSATLNISYYSG
jgi:hypothetical protein